MTSAEERLRPIRDHHRLVLAVSLGVLVLSCLLSFNGESRLTLPGLGGRSLPPMCASRLMFGIRCPGCGLTRSFVSLASGDWGASWRHHRLGWLVFVAVVLQVPYRLWGLFHPTGHPLGQVWPHRVLMGLFGLLLLNWVVSWWM